MALTTNQNEQMVNPSIEDAIASQIQAQDYQGYEEEPVINRPPMEERYHAPEEPVNMAQQYIGTQLQHTPAAMQSHKGDDTELVTEKKLSTLGSKITKTAEIRDGWIPVDRGLLGERDKFYPEEWMFYIKPADVEAIRHWSTIDAENPNSIDDVFDEVLKSCLSIKSISGNIPWHNVNVWDRFFFLLLIREYTFADGGEQKISFNRECPNCEVDVPFELVSTSLMFTLPDESVMKYYNQGKRTWEIIPSDFEVNTPQEMFEFYVPTREKDSNIKAWMIAELQENRNKKFDQVFIKFLPWMLPKVSKDMTVAKTQIKRAQTEFKSWDIEVFSFLNEVIDGITVTPGTDIITTCPSCGEEVTAPIQFPDGISSLFSIPRRSKGFGKK